MILRRGSRYVRAPIDKLGHYGLWIRHRLLRYILDGTPILLTLQNHQTPLRSSIMSFFSFLGTEDCFTCIIPLLTWILDARLGRLFTILLSLGFYIAGFFKCFFCLPRPPVPPIVPLDKEEGDWAFPSNHCTVGVLLPWYLWIYSYLHYDCWPWWARVLLFFISLIWFSGVTLSRLYLGVHSLADMAAGAIAGVWILVVYILVDDYIDYQCAAGEYVVLKAVILANILLYIHPRTNPETNSYGESVILSGSTVGVVASRVLTFSAQGRYSLLQSLNSFGELPLLTFLWRSLLRLVIGTSMIIGGRIILKPFLKTLCYKFYAYLELPAYSYKDYSQQYPPTTKHYTEAYRLPPLPIFESSLSASLFEDKDESDGGVDGEQGPLVNGLKHRNIEVAGICHSSSSTSNGKSSLKTTCQNGQHHVGPVRFEERTDDLHNSENDTNQNGDIDVDEVDALPYDVDIPSRFITYSLLGWILGEGAPAVFDLLKI